MTLFGSTMTPDFFKLSYLQIGTEIQQKGLEAIQHIYAMDILKDFDPVLVGTLPLDIFIEGSDLDILCFSKDLLQAELTIKREFSHHDQFILQSMVMGSTPTLVANFIVKTFPFEIFTQPIPTRQQVGYRHLVNEYTILQQHGAAFKEKIIALKKQGIKTEPAFAQLLGLTGDPYAAMLQIR